MWDDLSEEASELLQTGNAGRARAVLVEAGGAMGESQRAEVRTGQFQFGLESAAAWLLRLFAALALGIAAVVAAVGVFPLLPSPSPLREYDHTWLSDDLWYVLPSALPGLLSLGFLRSLAELRWWTDVRRDELTARIDKALAEKEQR